MASADLKVRSWNAAEEGCEGSGALARAEGEESAGGKHGTRRNQVQPDGDGRE